MGLGENLFKKNKLISSSEFLEDVKAIVSVLKNIDSNITVYLFGSVATNTATTYSDIDIAVITSDHEKKQQLRKMFYLKKKITSCSVDLVILTQEQFKDDINHPIAQVIESEGIQLYPDWKWLNG